MKNDKKQKDQIPDETFATRRRRVRRQGHQARSHRRPRARASRGGDDDDGDGEPPAPVRRPGEVVPLGKPAVAAKPSSRDASQPSPFRIFRVRRLTELFDVDASTIWRWRKSGVLPAPVQIGGIHGWTEAQLAPLMQRLMPAGVR